jgi:hypothetical protein
MPVSKLANALRRFAKPVRDRCVRRDTVKRLVPKRLPAREMRLIKLADRDMLAHRIAAEPTGSSMIEAQKSFIRVK